MEHLWGVPSKVGSWPCPQTLDEAGWPYKDNHSGLLWTFFNYNLKQFFWHWPWNEHLLIGSKAGKIHYRKMKAGMAKLRDKTMYKWPRLPYYNYFSLAVSVQYLSETQESLQRSSCVFCLLPLVLVFPGVIVPQPWKCQREFNYPNINFIKLKHRDSASRMVKHRD